MSRIDLQKKYNEAYGELNSAEKMFVDNRDKYDNVCLLEAKADFATMSPSSLSTSELESWMFSGYADNRHNIEDALAFDTRVNGIDPSMIDPLAYSFEDRKEKDPVFRSMAEYFEKEYGTKTEDGVSVLFNEQKAAFVKTYDTSYEFEQLQEAFDGQDYVMDPEIMMYTAYEKSVVKEMDLDGMRDAVFEVVAAQELMNAGMTTVNEKVFADMVKHLSYGENYIDEVGMAEKKDRAIVKEEKGQNR